MPPTLPPFRPRRRRQPVTSAVRVVPLIDLHRLHQLLLAVVLMQLVDLAINLWRVSRG